jgi:phosphoglycerate dehydrogenase-like enzyme
LDDYQRIAFEFADWRAVREQAEVVVFADHVADPEQLAARLRGFEIVVAMRERTAFPAAVLDRLPDLRLLVTTHHANAAIDVAAAARNGVTVTGTGSVEAAAPELAWALLMALVRQIPAEDAAVRTGGWQHKVGLVLEGRTLGLLGLGRMGRAMAKYGQAFGMNVTAWSQNLTAERATAAGARLVTKAQLFRGADIVSVHVVSSPRSRGIVGAAELALLGPEGYLVNTSRGPIVDDGALIAALRDHTIAGAALDVFDVEPLPADHRLRTLPNTVLTPHIGYGTREMYEVFYREIVEDILAWLSGQPIRVIQPTEVLHAEMDPTVSPNVAGFGRGS